MTTPGNANLGMAYGKVRIDYESSGVAKATKDVESLQSTLVSADKNMGALSKSAGQAVAQINNFGAQTAKIGKNIKNPVAGLGDQVAKEVSAANKALADFESKTSNRKITVGANVKVVPKDVQIDSGALTRAVENWRKNVADLNLSTGATVKVAVSADLQQIQQIAQSVRDTFGRIVADQRAYGAAAMNSFAAGVNSNQQQIKSTAEKTGKDSGGLLAGGMGMALKSGAAAAGVAAVAAVGYVFKKGFDRIEGLDTAAMKLKALGFQTNEIKEISKNALDAVNKTAFSLDAAFATAANAISAGIKPGKELTDYLKMVADNAALAGTGMQEMGDIFNQVAVQGKLTGDIVQSLLSRGIDVYGNIAKSQKVSQAAAHDMVTNGVIDFEKFRAAMSLNSGAADTMGNTISGSFDNLMAAVKRISAAFLQPIFGDANGQASQVAKAIQWVTAKLGDLEHWMSSNQGKIVTFWEFIGKGALYALTGFATLGTGFTTIITGMLKSMSFFAKGWGELLSHIPGMGGLSKGMKDVSKTLDGWSNSTWDATKTQVGWIDSLGKGIDAIGSWADKARNGGNATSDLGNKSRDAIAPVTKLKDVLAKFGLKDNEFIGGLQGTNKEFKALLKTLKEKGATDGFLNFVKGMRNEFQNGGSAVKSFSEAIDKLGDSSASASDKADTLIDALKKMGLIPDDDALESYSEYIQKLGDAANSIISPIDTLGDSLVQLNGKVNFGAGKNAQELQKQLVEARKQFTQLAASGAVVPDEAYANITKNLTDALTSSFKLSPEAAQKVIDTYLPKDALLKSLKNAGDPEEAAKEVFGDKPAELESVLKMMTTQDDILKTVVPDGILKIPAQIDLTKGANSVYDLLSQLGFGNDRQPGQPGQQPGLGSAAGVGAQPNSFTIGSGNGPNSLASVINQLYGGAGVSDLSLQADAAARKIGALSDDQRNTVFGKDPQSMQALAPIMTMVQQAQGQGLNFAEAFAQGIDQGSDDVKQAVIKLAQLSEGLGNSPAPWGPLSGKGWTLQRGKVFGKAYADGISSTSSAVQGAVKGMAQGSTMGLDDRLTQMLKDMQDFSDIGKKFFDVGKQVSDLVMNSFKAINDLSGGRLFPKHYVKDPNKIPKANTQTPFGANTMTPGLSGIPGAGQNVNAPGQLGANPGQQDVANYIIDKALAAGYTHDQANAFVTQAFGESHLSASAFGANSGDSSGGASGIFQFTPDTWKDFGNGGDVNNAKDNIDAYFRMAQTRDPGQGDIKSRLAAISVGGPAAPSNVGHWETALKGSQQFINGYNGTNAGGSATVQVPTEPGITVGGQQIPKALEKTPVSTAQGNQVPNGPTSSNGWGMITDPSQLVNGPFGSQLQSGAPATILNNFAQWFNDNIEKVTGTSSWREGTAFDKQIRSNHLSGTALDLNPNDFPGFSGGRSSGAGAATHFSPDQIAAIRAQLAKYGGAVEWGEDWSGSSKDPMHFQLNQSGDKLGPNDPRTIAAYQMLTNGQGAQGNQGAVPVSLQNATPGALDGINSINAIPGSIQDMAKSNDALSQALRLTPGNMPVEQQLQGLDSKISDLTMQGTPESKKQADYLSSVRSGIMDRNGLKEAPSDLETAQSLLSGGSGVVSSVFNTIDSVIKTIGATKDLGDVFARGVANTADVGRIIDDFQNFLDLGSKVAQLVSDVSGFAGSMVGAAGSGDTSGTSQGIAMALGAVSTISGLVGQGFAAANAVIDLGQQVVALAGKYVGRAVTSMLGFPGASDMKFLLDTVTGQLQAYTSDNPQMKHTFDTMNREYHPNRYNDRAAPTNQFYIYQGPGQDPRDTMSSAMFQIKSSGQGAFGYAV